MPAQGPAFGILQASMSTETPQSNYWLDIAARDILRAHPTGEIVVSSGISPSASYHVGHFREIMTAEALAWALRKHGRAVKHVHVVDNFDPLRTWYDFLPPADRDYSGHPISAIPDPIGDGHASYADHFYSEFEQALGPMGILGKDFEIIKSYEDLYAPGRMNDAIERALAKTDEIKAVFRRLSNRELPDTWSPVAVIGADGRFEKGDITTWDREAHTLNGVDYRNGGAKLDWRLDWPARWALLGVQVEPFGAQEHGAAGSSYDTGAVFVRDVFGGTPPYGEVRYGHIHRPGEPVKMSSSKGNGVTPSEALKIMPPEILRYFIVRSRPERKIFFDPGVGLYNLIDEFAAAQNDPEHEFRDAYEFAVAGAATRVVSSIPFKHLVSVYQAARRDADETLRALDRSEYAEVARAEQDIVRAELDYVVGWLDSYAPESVKFELQESLPQIELEESQRQFVELLAGKLESAQGEVDGAEMHTLIYAAKDEAELSPKQAFIALYRLLLGQDHGPKAGWYLASLDRSWLVGRLRRQH